MTQVEFPLTSLDQSKAVAKVLAQTLRPPAILALTGNLGTGKTTFTQLLARALGLTSHLPSPTFSLLHEYALPSGTRFVHGDLYRLADEAEIVQLGLTDYFTDPITLTVIEWADRAPQLFPADTVWLHFELIGDRRVLTLFTERQDLWLKLEQSVCANAS